MFKRIKSFFLYLKAKTDANSMNLERIDNRVACLTQQMNSLSFDQNGYFKSLQSSIAENSKRLSSIEMEMLMARNACLDNNFPGKEDL